MKKLQLYVCLVFITISYSAFSQNPFTAIIQSDGYQETISDQDIPTRDIVHLDDVIVDGSLCVGQDCANGENFGFDTVRIKENNVRLHFDDTSNSASFPNNDWSLDANDSSNGGANYFAINDRTAGRIPFRVEAGAPANALYIEDSGELGLGTNNPVVEIHSVDGDTPTLRLEQDGSAGFGAQSWDIAGNETNFFVRDVTNGSALPFRIQPGSGADDALMIKNNGSVGIQAGNVFGSINPNASLDLGATDKGLQLNRMDNAGRTALGTALGAGEVGVIVFDTEDSSLYTWDGIAWIVGGTDDQGADVFQLNGDDLELSLEDDGVATQTVDLSGYLDNTDDQGADVFQLNGDDLELSLEDDGVATQTVDLSGYLDNTDDQNISGSGLAGNTLTIGIEGGTSEDIDLSSLDNSGTDDQQLTLTGNNLDLEDGGSVNLSTYLDNTDDQNIAGSGFTGNTLTIGIEGGASETVDLSALNNSGTDDQNLANFNLSAGSLLSLSIQDGNVVSVDLAPLLDELSGLVNDLQAENAAQQAQIDDLILRMEIQEDCACDPTLGLDDNELNPNRAYLLQNIPNPFDNTTTVGYFVPFTNGKATIVISTMAGQIVDNIQLSRLGVGSISVNKSRMASATYLYTLYVDGKRIDTKRMLVE